MPTGIFQLNELGGGGSRRFLRLLIVSSVVMLIMIVPFLIVFNFRGFSTEGILDFNVPKWWVAAITVGSVLMAMTFFHYFGFPWITSMDRRWPASLGFPDW